MHHLRFRQIHLDFHTSEKISNIGVDFERSHWQQTLQKAKVDSITCFAVCHHGWAYYNTNVGKRHPHLKFDLLREQFEACKEIDINVPIYLTAGINNMAATEHPEWRQIGPDGRLTGWAQSNIEPGFFQMCFNTGYLDFLCRQIEEVVDLFPGCDGIFLDIISQSQCVCHQCIASMQADGLDPLVEEDRKKHTRRVLLEYYRRATAAARKNNPEMPVFHNSGHINQGDSEILSYFSHLELESLPTGGWGYDHFPISAKYCQNLDHDFLGMTGKFHTTWGEFGGFKHPNALSYECAAMLAVGAKCSIGDQLHPRGRLDSTTYRIIGHAYRETAIKEAWCDNIQPISDIGLISSASVNHDSEEDNRDNPADVGAGRIMLEGHFLFDVLNPSMDFNGRKALLLADDIPVTPELKEKIDNFLATGGKLILSGRSGLNSSGDGLLWDIGADFEGSSPFQPDYILPAADVRPEFVDSPFVIYLPSCRLKPTTGQSIGDVYDPWFNRNYDHFCSHQHAPPRPDPSGYSCGVINPEGNILYFSHPVFTIYRIWGAVAYRHYITNTINRFLDGNLTLETNLPSTARIHLNRLPEQNNLVLHLLYANTVVRGGSMEMPGHEVKDTKPIEVIEELMPLHDIEINLRPGQEIKQITMEPQGIAVPRREENGVIKIVIPEIISHQMLEIKT